MKPSDHRNLDTILADIGDTIAGGFTLNSIQTEVPDYDRTAIIRFTRPSRSITNGIDELQYWLFFTGKTFKLSPVPVVVYPPLAALAAKVPDDPRLIGAEHEYVIEDIRKLMTEFYHFRSSLAALSGWTYSMGPSSVYSRIAGYDSFVHAATVRYPASIAVELFDKFTGVDEIENECFVGIRESQENAIAYAHRVPIGIQIFALFSDLYGIPAAGERVLAAVAESGLAVQVDYAKLKSFLFS